MPRAGDEMQSKFGNMTHIEFVFFDLGNVICNFSHELAWRQLADVAGVAEELVKEVVFESELQIRYETGTITTKEFYDEFCAATGSSPGISKLMAAGSDIFWLNYRIIPLIAQMRSARVPMGVLSNTCEAHWEFICKKFPTIETFFDKRILSYKVHCMKPDAGIYAAAAELAGVSPGKIFFSDDNPANVAAAVEFGMDALVFENAHNLSIELLHRGLKFNL